MEFDFLEPVNDAIVKFVGALSSQELGSKVVFHTQDQFPDIEKINIAIVGVLEDRTNINMVNEVNLTSVRKKLYGMFPGNWDASIADLGDILAGDSVEDTYFAVKKVVSSLIKNKVIPIVLGGSQDLTYALYRAYDDLEQMVNMVSVDNKFDFGKENESVSANSYLTQIIINEPNNLFNYCNIGYQTYYNSQEEIDLIEKWIDQGAVYKPHWSFIKPVKPELPEADESWVRNDIDYFVYAKMKEKGLSPSKETDKERLLKRVCLDLTGLPPTLEMQDRFLKTLW